MCKAVYIGSNKELQTSGWKEHETFLFLSELSDQNKIVKEKFTKEFVYYIGAYEACACGFFLDDENIDVNHPSDQDRIRSAQEMLNFIREQTTTQSVELYHCWMNEEKHRIESRLTLKIEDISLERNYFLADNDRVFIVFEKQRF